MTMSAGAAQGKCDRAANPGVGARDDGNLSFQQLKLGQSGQDRFRQLAVFVVAFHVIQFSGSAYFPVYRGRPRTPLSLQGVFSKQWRPQPGWSLAVIRPFPIASRNRIS